jgi:hypothetical protein
MSKLLEIKDCPECHHVIYSMGSPVACDLLCNQEAMYLDNEIKIRPDCPLKDVNPLNTFEQFIETYKNDANFKKDRFDVYDYNEQRVFTMQMSNGRKFQIAFSLEFGHIQWYDIEVDGY